MSRLLTTLKAVCGALTALAALELGLRAFVSTTPPPRPDIPHDALFAPSVVTREIDEGLGVARYSITGARLTGNEPLERASTIVLLGDSYVAAREVPDSATAGARLERMARAAGVRVNVRQYGWRGASPSQYLLVAGQVLARWSPEQVVVLLSNDDLDEHALAGPYPRVHVRRDGSVLVLRGFELRDTVPALVRHSVLAMLAWRRSTQLADRVPARVRRWMGRRPNGWNPQDSRQLAALPHAMVRALSEAYGRALAIVYVADVRVTGGSAQDLPELRLLDACAELDVPCASTREPMLAARREGRIARGFPTTTLGVGQMNAVGHAIVASTIWSLIGGATTRDVRTASSVDVLPDR